MAGGAWQPHASISRLNPSRFSRPFSATIRAMVSGITSPLPSTVANGVLAAPEVLTLRPSRQSFRSRFRLAWGALSPCQCGSRVNAVLLPATRGLSCRSSPNHCRLCIQSLCSTCALA